MPAAGLILCGGSFAPEQKLYTWWSYRAQDWRAPDRGRRLDHIWGSPTMSERAKDAAVLKEARDWNRPSDHVPLEGGLDGCWLNVQPQYAQ
jgi:exodeoxyribonuclease-3